MPRFHSRYDLLFTVLLFASIFIAGRCAIAAPGLSPAADEKTTATLFYFDESPSSRDPKVAASKLLSEGRISKDQYLYTSRPLLAVGTLNAVDVEAGTVSVDIDRSLSQLPNALESKAQRSDSLDAVLDREFPAKRTFTLSKHTALLDSRPDKERRQIPASSGRMLKDPRRMALEDFIPGDQVSVLFRMGRAAGQDPIVLNLSRVDRDQMAFKIDHDPTEARRSQFLGEAQKKKAKLMADRARRNDCLTTSPMKLTLPAAPGPAEPTE